MFKDSIYQSICTISVPQNNMKYKYIFVSSNECKVDDVLATTVSPNWHNFEPVDLVYLYPMTL